MNRIFDVTVPLSPDVPTFPGDPVFERRPVQRLEDGDACNLSRLSLGAHAGTHVDAPYHFLADGVTVDQLPLDVLMGAARVVAIPAERDCVDAKDLPPETLAGATRILLKTRNSGLLRRREFHEDFVYLTAAAAHTLVAAGVRLVGVDYLSVEKFGSADFPVHHALLAAGVVVVEGLDLTDVGAGDYDLACLPLRIAGGDGAPVRAVLRRAS
jgi:arylformamidase